MELLDGLTKIIIPIKPIKRPMTCFDIIFSLSQNNAMSIVINAVEEFNIANIFESEPFEASENKTKGMAVLVKLSIRMYLKLFLKSLSCLLRNNKGRNTKEANASLSWTKKTAPSSGVAIFMNMNALPQMEPKKINNDQ